MRAAKSRTRGRKGRVRERGSRLRNGNAKGAGENHYPIGMPCHGGFGGVFFFGLLVGGCGLGGGGGCGGVFGGVFVVFKVWGGCWFWVGWGGLCFVGFFWFFCFGGGGVGECGVPYGRGRLGRTIDKTGNRERADRQPADSQGPGQFTDKTISAEKREI